MKKRIIESYMYIALIIILIFFVINVFIFQSRLKVVKEAEKTAAEAAKPALIELVSIKASNCINCFDLSPVIESVKKGNINVTKEEILTSDSERAKELMSMYNITKIPALLIFGETNKTRISGFETVDDVLVYSQVNPLYVEVATGKVRGQVSVINVIDSSCKGCVSLSPILESLGEAGVVVTDMKDVEYDLTEGRQLIDRFDIKHVPAILISDEINYYDGMQQALSAVNAVEKQGFYAIHSTVPPYRNLTTNRIVGLVELIMLTDSSCTTCYNVTINKLIVQRSGVFISSEKNYDITSKEGKDLISKYSVQKVPIIIMSPDTSYYTNFVRIWRSVGSIESDGWFVMRSPDVVGTYKDLTTNQVVERE